jgi:predicted nucleic acid-binding protein
VTATLIDTSVAVPLLLASHPDHARVAAWAEGRDLAFAGHAIFETYAVLTRLPAQSRLKPAQAQEVIGQFGDDIRPALGGRAAVERCAALGIAGGQVYDALVAFAAQDRRLATRDRRALELYEKLGAEVETVG